MNSDQTKNLIDTKEKPLKCEKALLIAILHPDESSSIVEDHLKELCSLVDTMGIEVAEAITVPLRKPSPGLLLGKGKAEEICQLAQDIEADIIVFDDSLSPSQQRNLEKLSGVTVIDRQEVILDIFADRASTKEAVLQVGLARMNYSLPRLTRAWTHLSRQRGGAKGTRGEGETQLEVDRRLVLRKIDHLKRELKKVRAHRATQRKKRQRKPVTTASIVGYTNAGKSSLLNLLTKAEVLAEDKLFATLDPTTRRISLDSGQELVLTDTVGFIRKLPHDLIDAFKSTLEETVLADFLIHVLDISNHEYEEHNRTTLAVLKELEADDKPIITVFNKIDKLDSKPSEASYNKTLFPDAIYLSAETGEGTEALKEKIETILASQSMTIECHFPHDRHDLVALIHRNGSIISEKYEAQCIKIICTVPNKIARQLKEFLAEETS